MAKYRWIACVAVAAVCGTCWFAGATRANGYSDKGLAAAAVIGACGLAAAAAGMTLAAWARRPRPGAEPGAAADGAAR